MIDRIIGGLLAGLLIVIMMAAILGIIWLGYQVVVPQPTAFERFQATIEECVASELYSRERCVDFMTKGK